MAFFERIGRFCARLFGQNEPATSVAEGRPLTTSNVVVRVGKCTSIGYYRDNNEDRVFVDDDQAIYIVADGMGGQAAGEQASQLAIEMIPAALKRVPPSIEDANEIQQAVRSAIMAANEAILGKGAQDPTVQNMGTTVVVAVLRSGMLYVAHVGDSRAYYLHNGTFEVVTTDHSLAQALFDAGTISKEELKNHRFKNYLLKYLGSKDAEQGPDIRAFDAVPGGRLLLATDGLTGVLDDDVLHDVIARHDDPQKCADELVQMALEAGSKDNVSCVVIFLDPP